MKKTRNPKNKKPRGIGWRWNGNAWYRAKRIVATGASRSHAATAKSLDKRKVLAIRRDLARGKTKAQVARRWHVSAVTIGHIASGKTWGWV